MRNDVNRGFAAACNQGASGSEADYLLFLNPDTRLHPESLCRPIRFMESPNRRRVGICGVKLIDEGGGMAASCARFPSLAVYISQMLNLSRLFPKRFPSHFITSDELTESREVDQIIGAFFLIRKDMFVELNGFDERFFVYYEETDLSLRAKRVGYTSYYLADTMATHIGRVSSRQASTRTLFYSLSSRIKYTRKHFRTWEAIVLIVMIFSVEFFTRTVWSITGSSVFSFREILSAYMLLVLSFLPEGWQYR
jgi:GT2 family glycosyltransferase